MRRVGASFPPYWHISTSWDSSARRLSVPRFTLGHLAYEPNCPTGNCLAAAKRIGRESDAKLLPIPQLQKEGRYEIDGEEAVGIVFPVYGFALPLLVKRYIERCRISSPCAFVVATYGNIAGAALARGGNAADYYETLLAVDNYLPGYEIAEQVPRLPEKGTEDALERITSDIQKGILPFWFIISMSAPVVQFATRR